MRHDQSRCPTIRASEIGGNDELLANPTQSDHEATAFSYKGAFTQDIEQGLSRQIGRGSDNSKEISRGKGGVRSNTDYNIKAEVYTSHRERYSRYYGEGSSRNDMQSGYLPPQDLTKRYVVHAKGITGLKKGAPDQHLDASQKLMMDAFLSDNGVSFKGVKGLRFTEEPSGAQGEYLTSNDIHMVVDQEGYAGEENQAAVVEAEIEKRDQEEKREEHCYDSFVFPQGGYIMKTTSVVTDDGEASDSMEGVDKGEMEITMEEEAQESDEIEKVNDPGVEEEQIKKKKIVRAGISVIGGSTMKRLVQGLISPRQKQMLKQASKGEDKGFVLPKKAVLKPKSVQE